MPPEIVRELTIEPPLSTVSDDPNWEAKTSAGPPLSVSSENGPAGEVAPAGEVPESQQAKTEAPAEPPAEPEPPVKKVDETPPWMKAFISKTKAAEAQAKAEATEAKKQLAQALEALKTVTQPKVEATPPPQAPARDAYEDPAAYEKALGDYVDAKAEWAAERKVAERMDAMRRSETEAKQRAEAERSEAERQAFLEKARAKYDDFSDKCEIDTLAITPIMFEAAKDADGGEDVIYYLGEHPAEAMRISKLSPVKQVREIAKLEVKITAPPPVPVVTTKPTKPAPAPIKPVGASNMAQKTPEQETTEEYVSRRRREEAAKKGIHLP